MEDFIDQNSPDDYAPPPPVPFRRPEAAPARREMPASQEAEKHLLACCLLDATIVDRCINARLSDSAFFWPQNQTIFATIKRLHERKVALDEQVLMEELNAQNLFSQIGGLPYLMEITSGIPTTAHAGYFIEKVKDLDLRRRFIKNATAAIEGCYGLTGDMGEFMQKAEQDLLCITRDRAKAIRSWKDAVTQARAQLATMVATPVGVTLPGEVSWGFYDMNHAFGQMQPGQLVILAARPSIGKSSLMRQVVRKLLGNKVPTFIATLEVKDYAIARHMAQTDAGVSYSSLKRTRNPADTVLFDSALAKIEGLPLHTLDDFAATSGHICAQARLLHAKHPLGLIVVDHLQELTDGHGGRNQTTTEALGIVAKRFKALAGELDVPVLVLSQLNRSMEKEGRAPRLDDLRASGDIEQAADKVVFLHRPTHNPITNVPQPQTAPIDEVPNFFIQAEQAKGRDDGTGRVDLMFRRDIATFLPIQP